MAIAKLFAFHANKNKQCHQAPEKDTEPKYFKLYILDPDFLSKCMISLFCYNVQFTVSSSIIPKASFVQENNWCAESN